MADARTLLRAKRQEVRISHPLASYNASGQLRCIICGTLVKFASAWEGHLGSKAHRTNVARVKEEEHLREETREKEKEAEAAAIEKTEEERMQRGQQEDHQVGHKRKAVDDNDDVDGSDSTLPCKKQRIDAGFPIDFFSDPSRAPVFDASSEGEGGQDEQPTAVPTAIDLEYERFQREILQAPDFRETYERATVFAEPELVSGVLDGFPIGAGDVKVQEEEKSEMTEEEKRQQKEAEEKELIMDRFLEEERAQEEADMKVQMMKDRLEAFKKHREASRAAKAARKVAW